LGYKNKKIILKNWHCAVLENNHPPPWREFHISPLPSSPEFPYFEHKNNPCHLSRICTGILYTSLTYPLKKSLARKCVELKVNTPNT